MLTRTCSGTLYDVLEVQNRNASTEEIRRQYKKMALKYHPDRNVGGSTNNAERFQEAEHAHAVLTNKSQRKVYDVFGSEGLAKLSFLFSDTENQGEEEEVVASMAVSVLTNLKILVRLSYIFCALVVAIFVSGLLSLYKFDHYYNIYTAVDGNVIGGANKWKWSVLFIPYWILIAPLGLVLALALLFSVFHLIKAWYGLLRFACCPGRQNEHDDEEPVVEETYENNNNNNSNNRADVGIDPAAAHTDVHQRTQRRKRLGEVLIGLANAHDYLFLMIELVFLLIVFPALLCAALSFKLTPFYNITSGIFFYLCVWTLHSLLDLVPPLYWARAQQQDELLANMGGTASDAGRARPPSVLRGRIHIAELLKVMLTFLLVELWLLNCRERGRQQELYHRLSDKSSVEFTSFWKVNAGVIALVGLRFAGAAFWHCYIYILTRRGAIAHVNPSEGDAEDEGIHSAKDLAVAVATSGLVYAPMLFTICMWTQKLNVKLNFEAPGTRNSSPGKHYNPSAFTASFFPIVGHAVFILAVLVMCWALRSAEQAIIQDREADAHDASARGSTTVVNMGASGPSEDYPPHYGSNAKASPPTVAVAGNTHPKQSGTLSELD